MALLDQFHLGQNAIFQNRVRSSMVARALIVFQEAQDTAGHGKRAQLSQAVLNDPAGYAPRFAIYAATDGPVATAAGTVTAANGDTQQALASDAQITTAVASAWSAMAGV